MERVVRLFGIVVMAVVGVWMVGDPSRVEAQTRLCFSEVPDCIEGRFAEYWQQNGGLPVFGFPIGPARTESVGGGQFLVQPFERNRFELHPENARPYDVLLGRLGDDRLRQVGRPWENEPKAATSSKAGCQYFSQTGHLVCDQFLSYWRSNGLNLDGRAGFTEAESLALFGLPLTEATMETGSDGRMYLTQWFERARFELHPEIGPNTVLLGLLGREMQAPTPQPVPQPQPQPETCNDVPEPVNVRIRPGKCIEAGVELSVDFFGFRANENVGFWINAPEGFIVGTVETFNIGPTGALNDVPISTSGFTPGIWSIVMEGTSSGHKAIAYFKILGSTPPPPSGGDTSVPASVSAEISPSSGRGGTLFEAYGYGFRANENIGVYLTGPDQSVYGAPFQVRADSDGFSEYVTFQSDRSMPTGVYAITFEGVSSGHRAIAYFRILP